MKSRNDVPRIGGDVKNPTNLENARGKGTGQPSSRMREEKRFLQAKGDSSSLVAFLDKERYLG